METKIGCRRGIVRAGIAAILAGLVGACADQSEPAPVFMKGAAPMVAAPALPPPAPREVTVQRGQTLRGLANVYHVPASAIIAANRLKPPYELKTGTRLVIPGAESPSMQQAMAPISIPPAVAAAPLPPLHSGAPLPPIPQKPLAPETLTPPPSATRVLPNIIPLDGPPPQTVPAAPAAASASAPAAIMPPRNPAAALPLPSDAIGPQATADAPAGTIGGRFPWPVRGRILASYGSALGNGRNDGINIAAPRGTPVRAIDGGTVAYAGNEVKGYGNLVLIKHADGWISAYAHLDELTLKPGDKVAAGEVIGHVSDSGGVAEPQLHFELRRGKKPVDPSEFLGPAPSAANPPQNKAG